MKMHWQNIAIVLTSLLFVFVLTLPINAENADKTCRKFQAAQNSNTVLENTRNPIQPLNSSHFLDQTSMLLLDEIIAQDFNSSQCETKIQSLLPGETLWLRFSVQSKNDHPINWSFTFMERIFDRIVLYELRQNNLIEIAQNGRIVSSLEATDRAIKPALPIRLGPNQAKTYYVSIEGSLEPSITPVIVPANFHSDWSDAITLIASLFLGYLLSLIIFGLILFRQIEVRFYKHYTLYLASLFVFSFIYGGLAFQLLSLTTSVIFVAPFVFFVSGIGQFAFIQYCRILLEIDDRQPRMRWLFIVLSAIVVMITVLAAFDPWRLSRPLQLFYVLGPVIVLCVALIRIRDGILQAKPIALSLLLYSSGLAITVYYFIFPLEIAQATHAYDLILSSPLAWGYYIAIIGETIFMLVAISMMVKAQRRSALAEANALRLSVSDHELMLKKSDARINALEASLAQDANIKLLPPADKRFLKRATDCIIAQIGNENYGVRELAADLATSEKTLGRRIQKMSNLTSAAFIRSTRLGFTRELLLLHQYKTVSEVATAAGFSSVSYFSKMYRQEFNETPSETLKR
ncbi:MAG: helix-turn-helix domain-containing protein [Hyphomicrobiales bacterium]